MTDDTKEKVIDKVAAAFMDWDDSKSAHLRKAKYDLAPEHILIAVFMDAIYKHHCGSKFEANTIPTNADIKNLFDTIRETLLSGLVSKDVAESLQHVAEWEFEPHLEEILVDLLGKKFSAVPHLRDIAEEHRWRLLVDRSKIEILEKHGIDGTNPYLAILFSFEPWPASGYARNTALGWIAAMDGLEQKLTVEKAHEIHAIGSPDSGFHPYMRFGAFATKDGLMEVAESTDLFAAYGIASLIDVKDSCFYRNPEGANELAKSSSEEPDALDILGTPYLPIADRSASSVKELIADQFAAGRHVFKLSRVGLPEGDENSQRAILDTAISNFMKPVNKLLDRIRSSGSSRTDTGNPSKDEIFECVARAYLRLEHLHAKRDGNYRLWGLYARNIWLAQAGHGISLVRDPNDGDGFSCAELADALKEGEEFCIFLRKDFRDHLMLDPDAHFAGLGQALADGDIKTINRMLKIARLYPDQSPSESTIHSLLARAIADKGVPPRIRIALTEFPHFDSRAATSEHRTWLSLAAEANDSELCSRLLCLGADPSSIEPRIELDESIRELLNAASILRRFDPIIEKNDRIFRTPLFLAVKSYNLTALKDMVLPEVGTSPIRFIVDLLKKNYPFAALATVVAAKSQLFGETEKTSPSDLKGLMQERQQDGLPLLSYLISDSSREASAVSFLACLAEMPLLDETKLEILIEPDETGKRALHLAAEGGSRDITDRIIDLVEKLNVPSHKKLDAITACTDDGMSALDYAATHAIADRILSAIDNSDASDRQKLEAVAPWRENNVSALRNWIEVDNFDMVQKLTDFILNLHTISPSEKMALLYKKEGIQKAELPEMSEAMEEVVNDFLEKLKNPMIQTSVAVDTGLDESGEGNPWKRKREKTPSKSPTSNNGSDIERPRAKRR